MAAGNWNPNNDHVVGNGPSDTISSLRWSPSHDGMLLAGSWDTSVRVFEVQSDGRQMRSVRAPLAAVAADAAGGVALRAWEGAEGLGCRWRVERCTEALTRVPCARSCPR